MIPALAGLPATCATKPSTLLNTWLPVQTETAGHRAAQHALLASIHTVSHSSWPRQDVKDTARSVLLAFPHSSTLCCGRFVGTIQALKGNSWVFSNPPLRCTSGSLALSWGSEDPILLGRPPQNHRCTRSSNPCRRGARMEHSASQNVPSFHNRSCTLPPAPVHVMMRESMIAHF